MSKESIRRWLALTLVVAGLAAVSAKVDGYYYARRGYVGGGSVHYGSTGAAATRTTTTTAAGSVRYGSGRYGSRTTTTTISKTYSSAYMARLPRGYHTMPGAGGKTYAYYSKPPSGGQTMAVGTTKYYVHNSVYYKPTSYHGARVYMAVPPPR